MKFGASTACFYPLETEKALKKVCELGYKYAEVFMNAPSELEEPFLKQEFKEQYLQYYQQVNRYIGKRTSFK